MPACYADESHYCGDQQRDPDEDCDGTPGAETCSVRGHWGGALSCRACSLDDSGCFDAVAITAGALHSCALDSAGQAWCWGANELGQLGDGRIVAAWSPAPFRRPAPLRAVLARDSVTCALDDDGDVWCTEPPEFGPVELMPRALGRRLVRLLALRRDVRGAYLVALDADGATRYQRLPLTGEAFLDEWRVVSEQPLLAVLPVQLEDAPDELLALDRAGNLVRYRGEAATPEPVWSATGFVELVGGTGHVCGRSVEGRTACWGGNAEGQLGDGTRDPRAEPVEVAGGHRFRALAAAPGRTCGIDVAGDVWCWGRGPAEDDGPSSTPRREGVGGEPYLAVALGASHTCALSRGAVRCWGRNDRGQVGVAPPDWRAPLPVAEGVAGVTLRSIGEYELVACAWSSRGDASCWGQNHLAQLGLGDHRDRLLPSPRADQRHRTLAAGEGATWALLDGGTVTCAGVSCPVPALVPEVMVGWPRLEQLRSGPRHTCGLDGAGQAFCWGENFAGQLGVPSGEERGGPVRVPGERSFTTLSLGSAFTCGLDPEGRAHCWGASSGPSPASVQGVPALVSLHSGPEGTCGLDADGQAWCWGTLPGAPQAQEPRPFTPERRFRSLCFDWLHLCAIERDGQAWCSGEGSDGQLGSGDGLPASMVAVAGGHDLETIHCARRATCAIDRGGRLWCWGGGGTPIGADLFQRAPAVVEHAR